MIVEIKGVEFENKGALLMLASILEKLKEKWPDVEIALSPSVKSSYLQRASVPAWQKFSLRKHVIDLNSLTYRLPVYFRRRLKAWGIVTEVDIDMIIDASGFSYSDQWPSKIRIYHLKKELVRFKNKGKPYIFMPQAFGPFTTKSSRVRIADSFKYAAMICAREQQSYDNLAELTGPIPNLHQYGDFTNLTSGTIPSWYLGEKQACIVPNKNMVNPRNANKTWIKRYESMLVTAIDYYREKGLSPFFLNHEGNEDGELITRVNSELEEPIPVISEPDALKVKGIIGSSRAVLCSRYHGCISALSAGIACIGTSWSHKYELLYDQYGANELLLSSEVTDDELKAVIDLSLRLDGAQVDAIAKQASLLKHKAGEMWQQFDSVVDHFVGLAETK